MAKEGSWEIMHEENKIFNTVSEIEVAYKTKVKPSDMRHITNSRDSYDVLKDLYGDDTIQMREEFVILLLNRHNKVLGWYKLSTGGVSGTVVDSKIIFAIALKGLASGIVLCHNHPSGNVKPSSQDEGLTKQIKEACKLLDISLIDHLIINSEGDYYSFADEGQI